MNDKSYFERVTTKIALYFLLFELLFVVPYHIISDNDHIKVIFALSLTIPKLIIKYMVLSDTELRYLSLKNPHYLYVIAHYKICMQTPALVIDVISIAWNCSLLISNINENKHNSTKNAPAHHRDFFLFYSAVTIVIECLSLCLFSIWYLGEWKNILFGKNSDFLAGEEPIIIYD